MTRLSADRPIWLDTLPDMISSGQDGRMKKRPTRSCSPGRPFRPRGRQGRYRRLGRRNNWKRAEWAEQQTTEDLRPFPPSQTVGLGQTADIGLQLVKSAAPGQFLISQGSWMVETVDTGGTEDRVVLVSRLSL